MADKSTDTKTFAQFLEEQPAPAETITLTGYVTRTATPGKFSFASGGQTMELSTDAVKSHKVLAEGAQKLVELEITASQVDASKVVKSAASDAVVAKNPLSDHYTIKEVTSDYISDKHVHKDPILDPITIAEGHVVDPGPLVTNPAAVATPFVLATPHHAPAATIAAQLGVSPTAHVASTAISDLATIAVHDRQTWKEVVKDPILDPITLPETIIPDPTNTAAEGIGVQIGHGQVVNPVNPAIQMQALSAGVGQTVSQSPVAQLASTPLSDFVTVAYFDRPHTIKELIKDPITDPITWVENIPGGGGGTLQEGVGGGGLTTNPVWNLPGMMF